MQVDESYRENILIVDDTLANLRLLVQMLQNEGYRIRPARDSSLALQAAMDDPPDLVLLDINMPGLNGYQVCRRLKEDVRTREVPVIFISALDAVSDRIEGFEAGGVDYIGKPFQAEEVLARVRTHLALYRLQRRLEANLRLREDLANMIAHDMRGPLTAIVGYAGMLERSVTEPQDREDVKIIEREADRLNGFLNDMLMLSKMEADRPIVNRLPVNVNQLLSETVKHHHVMARSRQIEFAIELPQEMVLVSLDPNLFSRVLDNLISNALKYAPAQSTVTLQVEYPSAEGDPGDKVMPAGNSVRIRVLDHGPGIPEEYRDRIFEKYEIVDLKKEGILSIGLGLAFCKLVVKAHGGRIYVGANDPVGSVFVVEI